MSSWLLNLYLLVFVPPCINNHLGWQEGEDIWEDDCSVSESSSICGPNIRIREFNNPHYNGGDSGSNQDGKSFHLPTCIIKGLINCWYSRVELNQVLSLYLYYPFACTEDLDEYCKEVRCVELEESSRDNSEYLDPSPSDNGVLALTGSGGGNGSSQEISTNLNEDSQNQGNSTYGLRNEQSLHVMLGNMSNYKNIKLTRSRSCSEYHMTGSPETGEMERTPANGFETGFPGRPDGLWRKFPPLNYDDSTRFSRNDSQSSIGSPSVDELRGNSMRTSADDDVTSIHTFVAGMKEMVKLEYEKQVRINNSSFLFDS